MSLVLLFLFFVFSKKCLKRTEKSDSYLKTFPNLMFKDNYATGLIVESLYDLDNTLLYFNVSDE